jgi:hypothetical protein
MNEFLLIEAASDKDGKKHFKVQGLAYSGGKINLPGWEHPVVVDLSGMEIPETIPLLTNHENRTGSRVGVVKANIEDGVLVIEGEILSTSNLAKGIVEQSQAGADWQLSIGAEVHDAELIHDQKEVNGQRHSGPFYHIKKSTLREVSVVAVGADATTHMKVAAQFNLYGGKIMDYEKWLKAHGIDASCLDEKTQKALKTAFDKGEDPSTVIEAGKNTSGNLNGIQGQENPDVAASMVREEAHQAIKKERERVSAIQEICAGEFPQIERDAIKSGLSLEDTSKRVLKAMRENRPHVDIHLNTGRDEIKTCNSDLLEAACALTAKLSRPENHYDEEVLDKAENRFRGGIGLQELILEAAWANGYQERNFRESREALRFAFGRQIQAGLSTVDIGGIVSNIANKFLLEGFYSVERTWRNICSIRNVSDFKTVTSYRLIGKDQYEQVAPGGELKHGTLGEESYTNKADTYGLMLSIDRRDIINDDLGAITLVPRKLGRGSGLKINDVFWTAFLNNASFFSAANNNYLVGADTVLGIDGLTKAETAFMEQVDSDGKPIGVMPSFVLVPPALNAIASQLNKSMEMRDTSTNRKYPVSNPHQGKFRTEVSRYLSNSQFPGNSQKAWYLLSDSNDLPVIEVAFLNGQESPVIETADADFNVLGIQMRGYHDFGVALQEFRGGVKMKGEV